MQRDPSLGGRGLALAGLIIGYIGIAGSIAFLCFVALGFFKARDFAKEMQSSGQWEVTESASETSGMDEPSLASPEIEITIPPGDPVSGNISGQAFKYSHSTLARNMSLLTVSDGAEFFADREVKIFLFGKPGERLANRTWTISADSQGSKPHVHLTWQENDNRRTEILTSGYDLELKLGAISGGRIPGSLRLKTAGKVTAELQGNFTAVVK